MIYRSKRTTNHIHISTMDWYKSKIMKRRNFIIGCSAGMALSVLPGVQSFAFAPNRELDSKKEIFIFLFLRGGFDALHFLAPIGDRHYHAARGKGLKVDEKEGLAIKNGLGGLDFALHPNAKPLKELYDSNQLAFVHATGLPNGTRSHFDAMNIMEAGLLEKKGGSSGWLSRYLEAVELGDSILPAVASSGQLPNSFLGSNIAASISKVEDFNLHADPRLMGILGKLYHGDGLLDKTAQTTLNTIKQVQNKLERKGNKVAPYKAEHGAEYPQEWYIKSFSESMQNLARLIKMEMGLHTATVDFGGWDTHDNQAWQFPQKLKGLSETLAAFYNDLQRYHKRLNIVVMSEFGRRLKANKSGGTDHGHGGVAMILGAKVKGGRMYGDWPGLSNEELDNRVDLNVTTDYRQIFAEVVDKHLGEQDKLAKVFPGFDTYKPLGFLG
jgi:uncharacterized protein (DUF1501 family)